MGRLVEAKLADYNVQAKVVGVYPVPSLPASSWTWRRA